MMSISLSQIIANELNCYPEQVNAVIALLDAGNTVPFIARYRKEITGALDDTQLRTLEGRLSYLRELNERRQTILRSIEEQGKLTDALAEALQKTLNKSELEALYLPYKPKRRTRGQKAIEAGLLPLAETLWQTPEHDPEQLAKQFIQPDHHIHDVKSALDGARSILMERFAEDAGLLAKIRDYLTRNAYLVARVIDGKAEEGKKFRDYFNYQEPLSKVPSHRALALFRGRNEGILMLSLNADPANDAATKESYCQHLIADYLNVHLDQAPADKWRYSVISWCWRLKILMYMETELLSTLHDRAEEEAIHVFAKNIHDLLMAAPAGMKTTMGLDPGLRTGVKVAVVDTTGKVIATETVYPHTGQLDKAQSIIADLCLTHQVALVAIGNGTASRETERFYLDLQKRYPAVTAQKVIVSEAGASVYSASELAANEFPDLDVSLRGAVSIARRLQDPLAELVKIDPKSIGVGQYQHDVSQLLLAKRLDSVVEDCVNAVGVDLNTASIPLLMRVAGLTASTAQQIVNWRNTHGRFTNRQQLLEVNRLGAKSFEQCAGFLRINHGDNPLDASAVHPETYPLVEKILAKTQRSISEIMGNSSFLNQLNVDQFTDAHFGRLTVIDTLKELEKPGRDPRPAFKTASFTEGVEHIFNLRVDMILEGTVTNVTNFGAFVDIGVHQDGLVHISLLSDKFVNDPHNVVKTGDIVKVKVIEVDHGRKRISLSMRLSDTKNEQKKVHSTVTMTSSQRNKNYSVATNTMGKAFAAAFNKLAK